MLLFCFFSVSSSTLNSICIQLGLESTYLMHKALDLVLKRRDFSQVKSLWPSPDYDHCWRRESCKFLVGSIYGRHAGLFRWCLEAFQEVWRHFAEAFGSKAVFVTHAGMSDWLLKRPEEFFLGSSGDRSQCRWGPRSRSILYYIIIPTPSCGANKRREQKSMSRIDDSKRKRRRLQESTIRRKNCRFRRCLPTVGA